MAAILQTFPNRFCYVKIVTFHENFTKFCSQLYYQEVSIDSGDGLKQKRLQTITWTNDDWQLCHHRQAMMIYSVIIGLEIFLCKFSEGAKN